MDIMKHARMLGPIAIGVAAFTLALISPISITAADQPPLAAPIIEISNTSPAVTVDPRRVIVALDELRSDDLGDDQEAAMDAVVASVKTWDATSGYGAVEANRANLDLVVTK
jgi:hypothetical protein